MFRTVLPIGLAFLCCSLASAQEDSQSTSTSRIYQPADFERFAPRNALDMVRQIPGFSFDDDDDGARGFGQASGNVLINGQRISGKSNGAQNALGRIPADNVERIEIVDGATLDIPGLSGQVANVIAQASEGITGNWRWEGRVRELSVPYFDAGEISASGKNGNIEWTLGLESEPRLRAADGVERVFDNSGTLIETRAEVFDWEGIRPSFSGSLNWNGDNGNIANLNASYTISEYNLEELSRRQSTDGGVQVDRFFQRSEDEWNTELGGDYEFGLGPGRLKLIGLYRFEHSPVQSRVRSTAIDGSSASDTVFEQIIDETENILRSEYSWAPRVGRDWQIALEGAFNKLESDADRFESFDFGTLGPDLITEPTAIVEEIRGDFAITHGRKLSEQFTLQTSLGVEVSEISQSGTQSASQSFTIPKGFVSASYNNDDGLTLSSRLERKVGQLNFSDFIASTDLNNQQDTDANPDLAPEKSWLLELEAERNFGEWGAGSVKFIGEEFEDLVGRIPLGTGDAVGNIDSATRLRIEVSGTWLLGPIGLKGMQIETEGYYQDFTLTDPLTNQTRRRSDGGIHRWEIGLRHDVPSTDWAWGFNINRELEEAEYALDQIEDRRFTDPFLIAFAEHKDIFGMTGILEIGNLMDTGDRTVRQIFETNRMGALSEIEIRERDFGYFLSFGLSGSF